MTIAILRNVILHAVQFKLALVDAVCHTTYGSSQETLARVIHVAVQLIVAQHDILHITITVGSPQRHHATTEVGHLHSDCTVRKGIKSHLLAIDGSGEILCLHKV